MRYPVGKGTTSDFNKYWYIASRFGVYRKEDNYYHSGDDYNLKTGADTDLGQPLYAIADGEITGIDTVSTTGFGKQIFLKFMAGGKTYWAMYAHCHSVNVKTGDKVKEGQKIGLLGKTGTTSAHLHFSIKNTANGMDNVPNTPTELKQWENPTAFIEKYIKETPKPTPSKPLKDTVIDFDDGEGKRKTVGWYVSEWHIEKTRAEKAEKELDEVREKTTGEIGRLNGAVRDLQSELVNIQKMAKTETKSLVQHIETGAKYSGSSIAIASALTLLITAFVPEMKDNIEVTTALQSVLTFGLNLVLIRFFKG